MDSPYSRFPAIDAEFDYLWLLSVWAVNKTVDDRTLKSVGYEYAPDRCFSKGFWKFQTINSTPEHGLFSHKMCVNNGSFLESVDVYCVLTEKGINYLKQEYFTHNGVELE